MLSVEESESWVDQKQTLIKSFYCFILLCALTKVLKIPESLKQQH